MIVIVFGMSFIYTNTVEFHLIIGGWIAVSGIGLFVYNIWKNLPTSQELENMSFRIGRIAAWLAPEKYASVILS